MNLNAREVSHLLTAIRLMQGLPDNFWVHHPVMDGHDPMSNGELDGLCEKINLGEDEEAEEPRRLGVQGNSVERVMVLGGNAPVLTILRGLEEEIMQRQNVALKNLLVALEEATDSGLFDWIAANGEEGDACTINNFCDTVTEATEESFA